jgi:alanine dehydrogenase
MRVGVPKEIKSDEYRVGLTPAAVREYVEHGHQVLVETRAGEGAGYSDQAYQRAGATIAPDAEAVFADATLIVKVKEPQAVEWARLTADHILFT